MSKCHAHKCAQGFDVCCLDCECCGMCHTECRCMPDCQYKGDEPETTKPKIICQWLLIIYFSVLIVFMGIMIICNINNIMMMQTDCLNGQNDMANQITLLQEPEPTVLQPTEFIITAYCAENYPHICNDGDSTKTATGTTPTPNRTIGVDPNVIPYGTNVYIDGMGVYTAEDCGGGVYRNRIDVLYATHAEAIEFGKRTLKVWILGGSHE